jgi:hypothetical protein
MSDRLQEDARLVQALRMTADPPQSWLDAAVEIPATLGDLTSIEQLVASDVFRTRFSESPESAVAEAGLPATPALVAALRAELA